VVAQFALSAYITPRRQSQLSPGEASLGFIIHSTCSPRLAYMPAVPQIDDALTRTTRFLRRSALRWHLLERRRIIRVQGSGQTAAQMGHVAVENTLIKLAGVRRPRKYSYISTTPIPCWTSRVLNIARCGARAGKSRRMDVSSICRISNHSASRTPAFARRVTHAIQARARSVITTSILFIC